MKPKKRIAEIVLLSLAAALLIYRGANHLWTKHKERVMYEQASANAVRYISEKYGFEPEITGSLTDAWDLHLQHDMMNLKAKYGDSEFTVFADCMKDNPVCVDNYQYDEVKQEIMGKISSEFPNGICVNYSIATDSSLLLGASEETAISIGFLAFQTYYDGTNLDEVLKDCYGKIEMVFADANFSDTAAADWLTERNIDLEFTTLDTAEHLAEFEAFPTEGFPFGNSRYAKLAPYITDHLEITKGEKKQGVDISFQSCGDFIYTYFPTENDDFLVSCEMTAEERSQADFTQHFSWYDEGEYVSKPITNSYYFNCRYGDIYVYYPLDKLKAYDLENIGAAWYSGGGFSSNRNIEKLSVCGDYAVFRLPYHQMEFMLVDTSGYDEYVPGWAKPANK